MRLFHEKTAAEVAPTSVGPLSCSPCSDCRPLLGLSERHRSRRWDCLNVFPGSNSPREQLPEPAKWSRYWSSDSAGESLWTHGCQRGKVWLQTNLIGETVMIIHRDMKLFFFYWLLNLWLLCSLSLLGFFAVFWMWVAGVNATAFESTCSKSNISPFLNIIHEPLCPFCVI